MDYKKESGLRLKAARNNAGWTLEVLSSHAKSLSVSRISNYEQGERLMDPGTAKVLAAALNVTAAYLLCVDDEPAYEAIKEKQSEYIESHRNKSTEERLISLFASLTAKQQAGLLSFLESLKPTLVQDPAAMIKPRRAKKKRKLSTS